MTSEKLIFRVHAIQRMFERRINDEDIRLILKNGEIIAEYLEDKPFPSRLILGYVHDRPLHVLTAKSLEKNETIVITVYQPDPEKWGSDFKRRRPK